MCSIRRCSLPFAIDSQYGSHASLLTPGPQPPGSRRPCPRPRPLNHDPTSIENDLEDSRSRQVRESIAEYFRSMKPISDGSSAPAFGTDFAGQERQYSSERTRQPEDFRQQGSLGPKLEPRGEAARQRDDTSSRDLPHMIGSSRLDTLVPELQRAFNIIQVHRSYLAAETPEGMIIVDQHALHERILFEKLSEQFSRGPLESQRYLLPESIDVSPDQVGVIETHAEIVRQLGFELSPFGPGTIAIQAAPTLLKDGRVLEFVRDLLDRLAVHDNPASAEMLTNDLLSMMACKAAVKAGDPLTLEEMQALMAQRDRVERSSNCPHGPSHDSPLHAQRP